MVGSAGSKYGRSSVSSVNGAFSFLDTSWVTTSVPGMQHIPSLYGRFKDMCFSVPHLFLAMYSGSISGLSEAKSTGVFSFISFSV